MLPKVEHELVFLKLVFLKNEETPLHDEWLLMQNIDTLFLGLSASLLSLMFVSHGSQHILDHLCLPSSQFIREHKLVYINLDERIKGVNCF